MKKISLLCVLLMILMITGCGYSTNEREEDKSQDKIELSFMMPQSHYRDFFRDELECFEKEYPKYKIDVLRIPDNQWIEVVKAKAATGELTDLVRIDKGLMEEIGAEKFVEMTEKEDWYDRVLTEQLENKKINGKLYGLPIGSSSSVGLVYNRDIFESLNLEVPRDMEAFEQACEKLKDNGYIPFYASDKDSWTATYGFSTAVSQMMTEEMYQQLLSGQKDWDNEEYRHILETFASLRQDGYTNPDYMQATYGGAVNALADGRAAMYLSGQFCIYDVQAINPKRNLEMAPNPYYGEILTVKSGVGMFAISAKSPYVEEAKVFLNWFSQPDNMNEFNTGWNHMPVFKDQEMEMSDWQEKLYSDYILPGKTALEINERFNGIDLSGFWDDQQKMYMGRMSSEEVLIKWDQSFRKQLKQKNSLTSS
ncbi:MAG TPA: carbohydrate ABC transporter substrate-binding protein [Candidatus Pelethocola excrementipullorum]|nr:carbohydrate ABC transporter substrate-binding protein [Candidatus Pelethocola excrementipullorum]